MSTAAQRSPGRGLFVAGTDTGVGKTRVACALLRALRALGVRVTAMKPVETGVGEPGPLDALALREAAGGDSHLDDICPERFELPAAPSVAAHAEGRRVDLARIDAAYQRLRGSHEVVVVEGAGGLRVPIDAGIDMAGLAKRFDSPVLLVARAALGTFNHTLLSLEALEREALGMLGVVISHTEGPLGDAHTRNLAALKDRLGAQLLGEIPPLGPGVPTPPNCLDVDTLWSRFEQLSGATRER